MSKKSLYIESSAGGERDYLGRYHESRVLGQGEFGVVKLIHDVKADDYSPDSSRPLAVKYLRKGYTFRDNTLYTPLKRAVLAGEVEILRRLAGECFTLLLVSVYESPSMIYMITEYCEGGMMMSWVSSAFGKSKCNGLRTEDVSRISYQLWSAVDHCAKHKVIHRDIKPDNVMFCTPEKDSQLRLIDFGSGTLGGDGDPTRMDMEEDQVERQHHTFAGSGFYISPEMFQRAYTSKTDVWSAGTTLYVLVAGYPADRLQETFDLLQGSKVGRLRNLPNLPNNLPDTFYAMLEGALGQRDTTRMEAGQLSMCEFAQFHIQHEMESVKLLSPTISINEIFADAAATAAAAAAGEASKNDVPLGMTPLSSSLTVHNKRTLSVVLEGSINRHNAYLGYQKFERSVTAVLATMLARDTCRKLLLSLREQLHNGQQRTTDLDASHANATKKLQVVSIKALLELLGTMPVADDREVKEVILMIQSLVGFESYVNFAYHIALLRQFVSMHARKKANSTSAANEDDKIKTVSSVHGNNVWSSLKKRRGLDLSGSGRSGSARRGELGAGVLGGQDADLSNNGGGGIRRIASSAEILRSMK